MSYGKATPYLPIIDLLKGYFRIAENDDARSIREKVTGKLLTLDRSLESLLTPLLTLLDQSVDDAQWQRLDPPQRRRQTLDALKRLWLREAQAQPLILVFEDLHWIDSETQAFLNGLMDSVPAAKLLLLFNYRPEYHHPWGSKTYYTQLRLDALTTESAQEFLDSLLGMHPSVGPLKQVLIERTEGNPFYLEESVRTSVETHALTGERGAYRLAKSLQEIQVPATVQAVLAARIDRLQPQDKHLLQTAAVLGKDVPYLLLREIADLTEDELRQRLAELQAAEFVYETSLYPDLEYTFRHALTHEVAYGSLLTERRRKLHGRIVQAIENLHAERLGERVDELGHHALRAEEWEKAVEYFRQAGVKAFEQSANRPAAAAFEQALAAIEHLPQTRTVIEQTVDLCLAMRPCLSPLADMKRLLASAQRAAPLLTSLGDARREALNVGYQAAALVNLGQTQEGIALAERAVAIAESLGDPLVRTSAYFFLGQARVRVGSFHKAIESFDRDAGITSDGLIDLSSNPSAGGTLQARSAVTSHLFSRVEGAEARSALGLFASAMDRAQEARCVAQRVRLLYFRAQADAALGLVHQNRGEIDAAISVLERACGLADAGGFLHYGTICLMHLADAYSLTGLPARARESVDRALKLVVDAGFRAREAWALYVRAGILARGSDADPVPVLENYAAALARADELAMRPLVAHCHLGLGSTYTGANDRKKAREHRTTALSMYREMGMQFWMEKAESALKELSAQ